MRLSVLMFSALTLALPALANDGVLEINQACAEGPGCFSGDFGGFPVRINGSAGTSYVLTGDLLVPDENTTAIVVSAANVSLDLGGFEIRGVTTCSGTPLVCGPIGTGGGVDSNLGRENVRVLNGTVVGMGSSGVSIGLHGIVENVRASQNGTDGIFSWNASLLRDNIADLNGRYGLWAGIGSTLTGNIAFGNGAIGVFADQGCTVAGNTAHSNNAEGIVAGTASTVTGNTASLNGADGIVGGDGSLIRGNATNQNGNDGIEGGSGATILDNTSYDNGDAVNPTADDGIECDLGCTVRGNTVRDNSGSGINLGADSAYRENVVTNNTTGGITGAGALNSRSNNYCAGTGVALPFCP